MPPGLFITFEGGEGSGKSTQVKRLRDRLQRRSIPVTVVREPGGTPLGDWLRQLLKFSPIPLTPEAELLLFNASRAQLVSQVVRPALARGEVVLCDRFSDSTLAYQGYGRGLPLEKVEAVNNAATDGLKPALVILLDISPEEGLRRRPTARDRFEGGAKEREVTAFHHRVHQGYLDLARKEPERWLVVDAHLSPRQVARDIWERVETLLESRQAARATHGGAGGEAPAGGLGVSPLGTAQTHISQTLNSALPVDTSEECGCRASPASPSPAGEGARG